MDLDTAPFVRRMFADYVAGKPMKQICEELDSQGICAPRGAKFGVKTLNKMLKNRAYIGEYRPASSWWMAACPPWLTRGRSMRCREGLTRTSARVPSGHAAWTIPRRHAVRGRAQHRGVLREVPACRL